jgi:hypothetical protein
MPLSGSGSSDCCDDGSDLRIGFGGPTRHHVVELLHVHSCPAGSCSHGPNYQRDVVLRRSLNLLEGSGYGIRE